VELGYGDVVSDAGRRTEQLIAWKLGVWSRAAMPCGIPQAATDAARDFLDKYGDFDVEHSHEPERYESVYNSSGMDSWELTSGGHTLMIGGPSDRRTFHAGS
jgi:hypothetical protein